MVLFQVPYMRGAVGKSNLPPPSMEERENEAPKGYFRLFSIGSPLRSGHDPRVGNHRETNIYVCEK